MTSPVDQWAGWTVPEGYTPITITSCRGCGASILWAKTPIAGRWSPHDRDGTSHFATCPKADLFRGRQRARHV
jgi:hypothetical protein